MKFTNKFFTPPQVITVLFLAFSALAGCSVEVNVGNTEPAKKTFTITFNANGGSGEIKAQSAESGSEITLTAKSPLQRTPSPEMATHFPAGTRRRTERAHLMTTRQKSR